MALPVQPDLVTTVSRSIAAIATEIATPAAQRRRILMSAELTLCVLRFWRLFARDSDQEEEGSSAAILNRFRRLLEETLSPAIARGRLREPSRHDADRLHALCSRELKRSPSALIRQRVVKEAAARLEASSATVKQIAFALGFKDTAYFSRFSASTRAKHLEPGVGALRPQQGWTVQADAGLR